MKARWKIGIGLAVLVVGAFLLLSRGNSAQRKLEETKQLLRKQGFKVDLKEFNLSLSEEENRRAALLATTTRAALTNRARRVPVMRNVPQLMKPVGKDAALVTWKLKTIAGNDGSDLWPELRDVLATDRTRHEKARQAATSGPIRFEPIGGPGIAALLPYLPDLKALETSFAVETVLALHDGRGAESWSNLLASTCLATEYHPEPIEVSHLVRMACATIAYEALWNALQAHEWDQKQLAELQARWEAADFWAGLPETAAYERACTVEGFQQELRQPLGLNMSLKQALSSPNYAWNDLIMYWQRLSYRHKGIYEEESALMLQYRNRELELRAAVRTDSWSEMRKLPVVTNIVPANVRGSSRTHSMLNLRALNMSFQSQGQGLLGRTANAESRRRLMITALALERYRVRHGNYPGELKALVPEFLKAEPIDFMDGKPLRFRLGEDGRFVLYSVGLDGVDNGGQMRRPRGIRPGLDMSDDYMAGFGYGEGTDLVWPRPATTAEEERLLEQERLARAERITGSEEAEAEAQWSRTASRQAEAEKILAKQPRPTTKEPTHHGHLLSESLRNEQTGTNKPTLAEMLTLKQVLTGREPEEATFELPIKYEALTNLGSLYLCVDPAPDEDSDEGSVAGDFECREATNRNCLLVWNTIYETPGKHALQAVMGLNEPQRPEDELSGPIAPFVVSNLCQFSLTSAHFEPDVGPTFRAKLPESNASYVIELKLPGGEHVRNLKGSTSNGLITEHWDLKDDEGKTCTNDAYDSVVEIRLSESGSVQKLRGP